jgi:hypothetical protein
MPIQAARLALLIALCASVPASAQEAAAARQECSVGRAHSEMRACLQAKVETSIRELGNAEAEMRNALKTWREEVVFAKRSASEFDASVKQFSHYRQQQCNFVASLAAGGNGQGDLRLSCIYEANAKRIVQIRQLQALVQRSRGLTITSSGLAFGQPLKSNVTVKAHHPPRTINPPAIARDQKCRPVRPLELAANQ